MTVNERDKAAGPVRIIYPIQRESGSRSRGHSRRWPAWVAAGGLIGAAAGLAGRLVLGWALWIAIPLAVVSGGLAALLSWLARPREAPAPPDLDTPAAG
jgi:hypothetical protein